MDYYETLGISKNASAEEIKKAYRRLAHQYHPDKGGKVGTADKFKEVNEAYQILSDPQKRQQYDQFGKAGFGQGAGGAGGFDGGGFDFSGFGFGGGLNDIFETFFSSAFLTVQAEVEITPAQAVLGDKMNIRVGKDTVEFNIPSGIQDGSQFQFRGKGNAGRNGQRCDLIITVRIKTPRHASAEQKELYKKIRDLEQNQRRGGFWNR